MSEKIYAWLLRLFPADFRDVYGGEALELFRDRARNEHSLLLRLRLWSDLLADLVISVPREHYRAYTRAEDECSSRGARNWPAFHLLTADHLHPALLLVGGALTILLQYELLTFSSSIHAASKQIASSPKDSLGAGLLVSGGDNLSVVEEFSNSTDEAKFATISITRSHSSGMRMRVLPNGDLTAQAVGLGSLLSIAYGLPDNPSPRLSGLPGWSLERYDIEAKAAAHAIPSAITSKEAFHYTQQMIRGLLAERFALDLNVEKKRMRVFALSVASEGVKLQRSSPGEEPCIFSTSPDGCHTFIIGFGHPLRAKAVDMDDLAEYLENWTDLPVVNRTALTGLFTLNTGGWLPMTLPPPPPGTTPNASVFARLPTIFTVLAGLGLTLDKEDATVAVYTIKHVERPASH